MSYSHIYKAYIDNVSNNPELTGVTQTRQPPQINSSINTTRYSLPNKPKIIKTTTPFTNQTVMDSTNMFPRDMNQQPLIKSDPIPGVKQTEYNVQTSPQMNIPLPQMNIKRLSQMKSSGIQSIHDDLEALVGESKELADTADKKSQEQKKARYISDKAKNAMKHVAELKKQMDKTT